MARGNAFDAALRALAAAALAGGCARAPRKAVPACAVSEPSGPAGERARGYELLACGRLAEAIAAFSTAASADPGDKRARMELGYARQSAGDLSAAADDFELASREPGEFQEQARAALKALREGGTSAGDVQRDSLLDEGYDALRKGENEAAREKFRLALAGDPRRPDIAKQLGYMSLEEGDFAGAARSFEGASGLAPDDCVATLELGYIYARLHNDAKAEKKFSEALWCPEKKAREAAAAALKNLRASDPSVYLDLYAAPLYTSRFEDKIAFFEAILGWKPRPRWPVSVYVAGRYTEDSRSRGGEIPEIYSDNAVEIGPGVKLQPRNMNLSLTAEWSAARNLTRSAEHPDRVEYNKRVVLADYFYWERRRLFADAGASLGYYSRNQDNVIAYLQARAGLSFWEGGAARASLYLPAYASKDGNRDFFNNFAEIGAGAELATISELSLRLRTEYVRGFYMGIEGRDPNPYARAYNDIRVMLIFSTRLSRMRRRPPQAPPPPKPGSASWPGFLW